MPLLMVLGPQIHRSVGSLAAVQTEKYQLGLDTHVSVMTKIKESKNSFCLSFVMGGFL